MCKLIPFLITSFQMLTTTISTHSHTTLNQRNLLVSQSQPEPTRPPIMGAYGQDCTPPFDDNAPDNCVSPGDTLTAPLGEIECVENFDCCLCGSIKCGFDVDSNGDLIECSEFHVNGDSGAFGVQSIEIIGSSDAGAVVNCGGDHACDGTAVYGLNIATVMCTGDYACAHSQWDLTCLDSAPCPVNCIGDHACTASTDSSSLFIVDNSAGLSCADLACANGVFVLESNIGEGSVACHGESACYGAIISINNIEDVVCGGVDACKNAIMRIVDPLQDFSLNCKAASACENLELQIILNRGSTTDFFKGFHCGGSSACFGASITVINLAPQYLTIESLDCGARLACKQADFHIVNGGFENCACGTNTQQSCVDTTGIDSCFAGLDKLECNGLNSCQRSDQTLSNIADGFELVCGSAGSCQSMHLVINVNDHADPVSLLKAIKCGANAACNGAEIEIHNTQSTEAIVVEKIECGGVDSCKNAEFFCEGAVTIKEIVCGKSGSCEGCVVNMDNQALVPCSTF